MCASFCSVCVCGWVTCDRFFNQEEWLWKARIAVPDTTCGVGAWQDSSSCGLGYGNLGSLLGTGSGVRLRLAQLGVGAELQSAFTSINLKWLTQPSQDL